MQSQDDEDEAFFNRILDEFAKPQISDEEIEASYQRFLKRPVVKDLVTGKFYFADRARTPTVGTTVETLRNLLELSEARFAMRFGLSVSQVDALELCPRTMDAPLEEIAKAVAPEIGVGPLKVLRVLKEYEAHRIAAEEPDEGPKVLAARKMPKP